MSLDQHQHGHAPDQGTPERVRPRLELPRFEFAPRASMAASSAPHSTPAPRTAAPAPTFTASGVLPKHAAAQAVHAPATQRTAYPRAAAVATTAHAPTMPVPTYASAPRVPAPHRTPVQQAPAQRGSAPVPHHFATAPLHAPAAYAPHPVAATTIATTPTRPATSISWERLDPIVEERSLLQRITPRHMGVLLVVAVLIMIMTSGPAAMKTPADSGLGALAEGGGTMPVQPRAGSAAVDGAAAAATPPVPVVAKPKVAAKAKVAVSGAKGGRVVTRAGGAGPSMIDVGGTALSANIQHGGMPSPAASERLGLVDGGGVNPALDDGVTLPTSSERDGFANERRVGGSGGADEVMPATPVMTPGQSAKLAEEIVAAPAGSTPSPNNIVAF